MRVALEHFEGRDIERIYWAATPDEARLVEQILDASPFLYTLDPEPASKITDALFGRSGGVAFFVCPRQAGACKRLLSERGLNIGLVEEESRL